jgi:hypothetical protein
VWVAELEGGKAPEAEHAPEEFKESTVSDQSYKFHKRSESVQSPVMIF